MCFNSEIKKNNNNSYLEIKMAPFDDILNTGTNHGAVNPPLPVLDSKSTRLSDFLCDDM